MTVLESNAEAKATFERVHFEPRTARPAKSPRLTITHSTGPLAGEIESKTSEGTA
jgi:hypothetical protein